MQSKNHYSKILLLSRLALMPFMSWIQRAVNVQFYLYFSAAKKLAMLSAGVWDRESFKDLNDILSTENVKHQLKRRLKKRKKRRVNAKPTHNITRVFCFIIFSRNFLSPKFLFSIYYLGNSSNHSCSSFVQIRRGLWNCLFQKVIVFV